MRRLTGKKDRTREMKRRGQERRGKMESKTKEGTRADLIARINARLLDQYKGQTIRLTAKIIKLNGETATVEASDGGQVSRSSSLILPLPLLRSPSSTFP